MPDEPKTTPLSPRMKAVLDMSARGFTREQTALALDISVSTVKVRLTQIRRRLGVATLREAIAVAVASGLLEAPQEQPRKDVCHCGREIRWAGEYWEHVEGAFRHVAQPASLSSAA